MRKYYFFIYLLLIQFTIDARSPIATTEGEPSAIVGGCLNAITGEIFIQENDIVISGVEPIHLPRTYLSSSREGKESGWYFVPDLYAAYYPDTERIEIPERNGTLLKYIRDRSSRGRCLDHHKKKGFRFKPELEEENTGWTNTATGILSGRQNQKNYNVFLDHKQKILHCIGGDGTTRVYKLVPNKERNSWEIYALQWERLANGNLICYGYDKQERLSSIETKNPAGTKRYAWAHFNYLGKSTDSRDVDIETSDVSVLRYRFQREGKKYSYTYFLSSISGPGIDEKIEYLPATTKTPRILYKRLFPDGRELAVDVYNKGNNYVGDILITLPNESDSKFERVKAVFAPVGKDANLYPAMRVFYNTEARSTHIYDLYNNLTVYHYTPEERLHKIERFENKHGTHNLYYTETLAWGKKGSHEEGLLLCKSMLDASGKGIRAIKYRYDNRGNVLEESLYGNLTGNCGIPLLIDPDHLPIENGIEKASVHRTYSDDDYNLILTEKYPNGLVKRFIYKPGTDLLSLELTCEGDHILQRRFFKYNEDNILVYEGMDDGTAEDPNNLVGVTQRTIRVLRLRTSEPFYGMPDEIKEGYLDLKTGKEIFLSKVVFTYGPLGKITRKDFYEARDQFSYAIEMSYDEAGNLLSETNALGQKSLYHYDRNNNKIRHVELASRCIHTYSYDFVNRPLEEKTTTSEGEIHCKRSEYNFNDSKVAEYDYFDNRTDISYDGFGKLLTTTLPNALDEENNPYRSTLIQEVDCEGHPIQTVDSRGNVQHTTYNVRGKPIEIRHPDGAIEKYAYSLDGLILSYCDPANTITHYTYDVLGREISRKVVSSSGEIVQETFKEYNSFHLKKTIDPNGNETCYSHDGAGRLVAEYFYNGSIIEKIQYEYDSLGRLHKIQKEGEIQCLEYDLLGRIIEERIENLTDEIQRKSCITFNEAGDIASSHKWIDGRESIEYFSYDGFHRIILCIDPLGQKTQFFYDEQKLDKFGQRILQKITIDPIGTETIETFDALGRLIEIVKRSPFEMQLFEEKLLYDRNDNVARQQYSILVEGKTLRQREILQCYDSLDRLIQTVDGYGSDSPKITEHTYTLTGQLRTTLKPNGVLLSRIYDSFNRLIELSSSDGSCHYRFAYDNLGNVIESEDLSLGNKIIRNYDGKGRLLDERLPIELTISRLYDENGKRQNLILPDQSSIDYQFNGANLVSITRNSLLGEMIYEYNAIQYDLSGNVLEELTIDGFSRSRYRFDALNRRSSIQSLGIQESILSYDPRGLPQEIFWQNPLGSYSEHFEFDGLKQLTAEKGPVSHQYKYDTHGNRISKNAISWQIDDNNQVLCDQETHYTYNTNGNLILAKSPQQETHYFYDGLDRLITILYPGRQRIRFTYDGFNRRLSKTVDSLENGKVQSQETVYYFYDNLHEIGSTYATGEIREFRVLGCTPKAEIGSAVGLEIKGIAYIPIHDIRGNVIGLVNAQTRELEEFYRYTSFGEEEIYNISKERIESSSLENPWRFASKRIDEETQLICFGRRYYNPKLGRWITPDPAGYSDGPNLYSFLLNNPLSRFDLFGLTALVDPDEPNLITHIASGIRSGYEACKPIIEEVGYRVGETIYKAAKHAPQVPIVSDLVKDFGRLLSQKEHKEYDSHVRSFGNEPLKGNVAITTVNGINNNIRGCERMNRMISEKFGGVQVLALYSKTHGVLTDIIHCIGGQLGIDWGDGKRLAQLWKDQLNSGVDRIHHFAHSRGGIVTNLAKRYMTEGQLSHIHVYTFGSPVNIDDDRFAEKQNYASPRDIVPMFSLSYYSSQILKSEKYTFLKHKKILFDHPIIGYTYSNHIGYIADNIIKSH